MVEAHLVPQHHTPHNHDAKTSEFVAQARQQGMVPGINVTVLLGGTVVFVSQARLQVEVLGQGRGEDEFRSEAEFADFLGAGKHGERFVHLAFTEQHLFVVGRSADVQDVFMPGLVVPEGVAEVQEGSRDGLDLLQGERGVARRHIAQPLCQTGPLPPRGVAPWWHPAPAG